MLLKLQDNDSNWIMYKEQIKNHLTSKGLMCHFTGTARKSIKVEEKEQKLHKKENVSPMSNDKLDTYLDNLDTYAQKKTQVWEVLYDTLSKMVILQIKGQTMAADVWTKLSSIFESIGGYDYNEHPC